MTADIFGGSPPPPPLWLQQWRAHRGKLFEAERLIALRSLDPDQWKLLCLRWDVQQGPHGFGTPDQLRQIMHIVRLSIPELSYEEQRVSCEWLASQGLPLPAPWRWDATKSRWVGGPKPRKSPIILVT